MNREKIYHGVMDWLQNAVGDAVVTYSRQLRHWNDVPAIEQPALFMAQAGEAICSPSVTAGWYLDIDLYIYCSSDSDPDTIAATAMNHILDKVTAALLPKMDIFGDNVQTLGGLVEDCKISGKIETDAGALGPQSVAVLPVRLIVTNNEE